MRNLFIGLYWLGWLSCAQAELTPEYEAMHAEIRRNADRFEMFPVEYDSDGRAPIRFLDPRKNFFFYDGKRFFGFRFKAPAELEGDFAWMYLLRSQHGPTSTGLTLWQIIRRNGPMEAFSNYDSTQVKRYPELKKQFPFTENLTLQYLGKGSFVPGEEYIIWFSLLKDDNPVEFAVAFSFGKAGQEELTARLPLGEPGKTGLSLEELDSRLTSTEGDPW